MTTLTAEPRLDKNGKLVTRHVKNDVSPTNQLRTVPAPSLKTIEEPSETVQFDDINIMRKLNIIDTSSSDCEKVESYLEDEYGASFSYDEEDDLIETISFPSQNEAERFMSDLHNNSLRDELKDLLRD